MNAAEQLVAASETNVMYTSGEQLQNDLKVLLNHARSWCSIKSFSYWTYRDDNLHHGRFLFRHKGKKKRGKPNYPPTKLIIKTRRQWRRKFPLELNRQMREDMRQSRRDWTQAIKEHNRERREARIAAKNRIVVRTVREMRTCP